MKRYVKRVDQHFASTEISRWIEGITEHVLQLRKEGRKLYLLTFMFEPVGGNKDRMVEAMLKVVEQIYARLITRVTRRPRKYASDLIMFIAPDLPVPHKDIRKLTKADATINLGAHACHSRY